MKSKAWMQQPWIRTSRAFTVVLSIALVASIAPLAAASGAPNDEAERLIARLQASNPDFLIERMHGNASADLQALMKLRFAATHSVIAHIEQLEATEPDSPLANALLHALGFVLDPASIPWLRKRLENGDHQRLAERWLPSRHYADSWIGESPWVEGKQRWFEFFGDAYASDPDPQRRRLWLTQLLSFTSAEATAMARRLRDRTDDPHEFLIIEAALSERGLTVDWSRVASEVDRLSHDPEQAPFLIEIALKLRHELFVPILIRNYDARPRGVTGLGSPPAHYSAMLITLQRGINGQAEWQRWWNENSSRRRSDWIAEQRGVCATGEEEAAITIGVRTVERVGLVP